MGQLILPAVAAAASVHNGSPVHFQGLLRHNLQQLANISTGSAPQCNNLYTDILASSSSLSNAHLLEAMDCFQDDLTRRIDYDLYAMILGILMIVACLVIDPLRIDKQQWTSWQLVGCWAVVGSFHPIACSGIDSSLCDDPWSMPALAILVSGSGVIAVALLQIGSHDLRRVFASLDRHLRQVSYFSAPNLPMLWVLIHMFRAVTVPTYRTTNKKFSNWILISKRI